MQSCHAGFFDSTLESIQSIMGEESDDSKIVAGLKEALWVGTGNAVDSVSRVDGYYRKTAIKIDIPPQIKKVAIEIKKLGYKKEVEDFILSMNRAAEKAAPGAKPLFVDAVREMNFEGARKILNGNETGATDYFKAKTSSKLYNVFKPIISESMDEFGVTRKYKEMMGKYESIPLAEKKNLDLDHYVTNKALDGLFYMVGEEEKKIRTDPAARVTQLLKDIFGK
jgi:hypothetical protein